MKERIISISGRPGLFRLVKQGRGMLIVESIDDAHTRFTVGMHDRVVSLNDISIYCQDDDRPLFSVLAAVGKKENNGPVSFNPRKVSASELHDYFADVLPDYDRDRVHDSDMRKLLVWYNLLVSGGITDFAAYTAEDAAENAAATSDSEPAGDTEEQK